jgi:hypothetical protein
MPIRYRRDRGIGKLRVKIRADEFRIWKIIWKLPLVVNYYQREFPTGNNFQNSAKQMQLSSLGTSQQR